MNLILLGAPGAGKGTQSKLLQEKLSIPQISTGDMLRAAQQARSSLGIEAQKYMAAGLLLPDDLIIRVMDERLRQEDCQAGFILDGFPRTLAQAEALTQMLSQQGKKLDGVLSLVVDPKELLKRLSGRRSCSHCGTGYHLLFAPPRVEGRCDLCSSPLIQREDDREDTVLKRLKVYHEQTAPVVEYYRNKSLLKEISGIGSVTEIFRRILAEFPAK